MRIIRLHEGKKQEPKRDISRFIWEPGDIVVLKNNDTDNDGDSEEDTDDDNE